jgi:anti-sigma B factor antagonist
VDLFCRPSTVGGAPVLQVSGELDLASVGMLRDAMFRFLGDHVGHTAYIDLDGVTALDDTALGILMGGAARARESGGDVVLVCTTPRLRNRFDSTRLSSAIDVRDRVAP